MKHIVSVLLVLICSATAVHAKNYSRKAPRPAASDHTWYGYDYNFTLDEGGDLVGINTFSKVYNQSPTQWKNSGYYGEGIRMLTGHETLTITVLPGFMNYKYTLNTAVTEWEWDTHRLKWVKRRDMPTNGIRTFTTKDGILSGAFEIPVTVGPLGVNFICGNSVNGMIPSGQKLLWKIYDYGESSPQTGISINSDGSNSINITTYLEDVERLDLSRNTQLGKFGNSELGDYVVLSFPYIRSFHHSYESPLLTVIAGMTHTGSSLEKYEEIALPMINCDKYVDPYEPVTEVLSNGHTRTSTLQPNGKSYYIETWSKDGYDYEHRYDEDGDHPTIGKKVVKDTTFIDISEYNWRERGYMVNNRYYMSSLYKDGDRYELDWSDFKKRGTAILDNKRKYWFTLTPDEMKPHYTIMEVSSPYSHKTFKLYVIKSQDPSGLITVSSKYSTELSYQAKRFLDFVNHPIIQKEYPSKFNIETITVDSNGSIYLPDINHLPFEQVEYYIYFNRMLNLSRHPNNPIKTLQKMIGMELDVPDYDVTKFDAKTIGKRTAKLIKELPKSFYSFLYDKTDYKKVKVTRLIKTDQKISVFVTAVNKSGQERTSELHLEDNLPIDKYLDFWETLARSTKN